MKLFKESSESQLLLKDLTQDMVNDDTKLYWVSPKTDVACPWDNAVEKVDDKYIYVTGHITSGGVAAEHDCSLKLDKATADKYYELLVEEY